MSEEFDYIGKRIPGIESVPKVTGAIKFLDDLTLPGMLHGKFLRSPYPHARVIKIDTSKAESLPGVKLILTPDDIMGKVPPMGPRPQSRNQYALEREVRYVGDEVATVCAIDEETAEKAIDLIDVEYEELPAVLDPEEAMKPGAPQLHEEAKNNILDQKRVRAGDIEAGFEEADYIFKGRFETSKQAHTCLETHCCLSSYDPFTDKLTHWTSTQSVFFCRLNLCDTLDMPANKVRVIKPEGMGGAFGSKSEIFPNDVCAALMSRRLGKPVKMYLSREEEFMATRTRHPFIRESEIGLKKDGTIVAWREKIVMDVGAYPSYGPRVALLTQATAPGPYKIPNIWIDTYLVYTNKSVSGAFRGFGDPQATFARESLLDIAAEQMGIDRVELRLKNIIKPADVPYTTSTGLIVRSCGIEECIKKAVDAVGWKDERKPNRGVGLACMIQWTCSKTDGDADFASGHVEVAPDGSAIVRTGNSDVGQGLYTVLAQVAAEELGIPLENVTIVGADSEVTPPGMGNYGSRSALVDGSAVKRAAEKAREKLLRVAGKMLEVSPEELVARRGKIYLKNDPGKAVDIGDVAAAAYFTSIDGDAGPIISEAVWASQTVPFDEDGCGNFAPAYAFAANAAEVEVDPETGQVKLVKFVCAHDVGRALNVDIVEGQIQGGAAQGIGYGLFEGIVYDEGTGQPLNPLFIDYKVPTAADLPDIQPIIANVVDPDIPLGNKGVGETALNCAAPAIANAIYNATGVRIKELPITPAKIQQVLKVKTVK